MAASSSSAASPLLYSCIAHGTTILTEHTASPSSGASSLASLVLPKIKHDRSQKLSYAHNNNLIHYIVDSTSDSSSTSGGLTAGGLTYLVISTQDLGQRVPFGYLLEAKKRFLGQYDPSRTDFGALPPYGAAAFNTKLKEMMIEYGTTDAGQNDAIGRAQRELNDAKGVMVQNIDKILERGDRLDNLINKTDRLGEGARDFRVRSRNLRRQMWWKNVRLMALLIVVVIFLVYLFVGFGCGLPAWSSCLR